MDFELPQEVRILKETIRRFVDNELIPIEMHAMDGPDLKPDIRKRLEAKTRELGLWLLEVPADLVRLSVGLETIDDILADLELGFAAAKA